ILTRRWQDTTCISPEKLSLLEMLNQRKSIMAMYMAQAFTTIDNKSPYDPPTGFVVVIRMFWNGLKFKRLNHAIKKKPLTISHHKWLIITSSSWARTKDPLINSQKIYLLIFIDIY